MMLRWFQKNITSICIGVLLRIIIWNLNTQSNLYYHYTAFLSYHPHTNESIQECALALENGWPLSNDVCDPSLNHRFIVLVSALIRWLGPIGLIIFCNVLQLAISMALSAAVAPMQSFSDLILLYWFNPFVCGLCRMSLVGSLFHFVVLCLIVVVKYERHSLVCVFVSILVSWDFKFLCLLPIFLLTCLKMSARRSILCTAVGYILVYFHSAAIKESNCQIETQVHAYFPSIGVLWYLDGQVFDSFAPYFNRLLSLQPLLYGYPLALRFQNTPNITFLVAVAIVVIFRKETNGGDIVLLLCLFFRSYPEICSNTKYKPILLMGIICPLVASPLLLRLWVSVGSGNGNFLFFQGLLMSFACCLGISGFLNAFLVHRPYIEKILV